MRCNPFRWLLGIMPILLLGGVAILGEREAACAAYAEFNRKYPNANASTKQAVLSEQRRASC